MALFGKADNGIDILTRFFQLEISMDDTFDADRLSQGELLGFIEQELDIEIGSYPILPSEVQIRRDRWLLNLSDEALLSLGHFYRAIRHIMNGLADDEEIARENFTYIERQMQILKYGYYFLSPDEVSYEGINYYPFSFVSKRPKHAAVGARHVVLQRIATVDAPPLIIRLLASITDLFSRIGRYDPPVRRCEECANPFIVLRADNVYCSHRCSNRAGTPRRRQKQSSVSFDY